MIATTKKRSVTSVLHLCYIFVTLSSAFGECPLFAGIKLSDAQKSSDEAADNSRPKRHPAGIVAAMMVVDFVMSVVAFRCWTMMRLFLRRVVLRGRRMLRGLMTRRRMRGATFTSCLGFF
jgi:hypothetical protein